MHMLLSFFPLHVAPAATVTPQHIVAGVSRSHASRGAFVFFCSLFGN